MVKFGLYLPVYGGWIRSSVNEKEETPTYSYVRQVAIEAEKIGIDSLWIPDHLLNPIKGESSFSLEAWTVAAAIAEVTKKVTIAHTTLCEAFRYPAVLAKQIVALNEISNGRFWLSIGAGWFKREYEAYGLPFYEHDERITRTKEAIQIIKKLWKEDGVTFKGKYYQIENGVLEPKPNPIPRIWYGGVTEASRNLAAEEVDGWLMNESTVEEVQKNINDMNERLKKKGRSKLQYGVPADTLIRETDKIAIEHMTQMHGDKKRLERVLNTGLIGSPETVVQKIKNLENSGVDHILLKLSPTLKELKQIKRIID
ncbi:MAG: LLM class flavin-dependent oxidoreductase [Nitrososphaeria archaeon]|jgi:FMNH2-dependent dimethyl sulfone monooxygenase